MVTRTYRLDHDLGFAPNPFFDWCSLACCMGPIRRYAKLGDVIIGIAGSAKDGLRRYHPQLIYWMRVDEALTFDEYWSDKRFARKRPQIPGPKMQMVGDRTYRNEPGCSGWSFDTSMHYISGAPQNNGGHVATDTKVNRVLVTQSYTYWGKCGPRVPAHLLPLFPVGRGHKCPKDVTLLGELYALIDLSRPLGLVGDPADWDNPRYFKA
ncbi:hypothetical protein [Asticcacaulis sp.]|uniref:Nmad2 family putative nucleotide modification protein n=1 Tax=Asticcacaulis sp. TaxID=1872648 RepID=UPI0034577BC9